MTTHSLAELIAQRQRQVVVHAFLYYVCGESIVSDATYERWFRELGRLQAQHPDIAASGPLWSLCSWIDADERSYSFEGRGIGRSDYPPNVVNAALRLLANVKGKAFAEVAEQHGYQVESNKKRKGSK